jgi:lysophospholipase L1-like esterase
MKAGANLGQKLDAVSRQLPANEPISNAPRKNLMKRIQELLNHAEPVKWLFYGDSITHGALHTFGYRDYVELFVERVRFELGRYTDIVVNTAISGNNSQSLIDGFDLRVEQFSPNVVFIMIGMNDCDVSRNISRSQFEANLQALCGRIGAMADAVPVLQTTCPILPQTSPTREPYFDDYMQTIRDVAQALAVPLIDHTAYWNAAFAEQSMLHHMWMNDGFHPNYHGHRVFAELIFKELDIYDATSQTCKLSHP